MEEKNLVIIGNRSFARMLKKYIDSVHFGTVIAYAVEEEYIDKGEMDGVKVIPLDELNVKYQAKQIKLVMGIGYSQMNTVRKKLFRLCKHMGYNFVNFIHPKAYIAPDVQMGEGNNFFEFADVQMGAKIGDANIFLAGSFLGHDSIAENFNTFGVKSAIAGFTQIGSNCFFGTSSTAKHEIVIGDYVFVGASGYVHKNLKDHKIVIPKPNMFLEGEENVYII